MKRIKKPWIVPFHIWIGFLILAMSAVLPSCSDSDSGNTTYFPVLEVSGSHYDIGHAVGTTFKDRIATSFEDTADLLDKVEAFIATDRQRFYTQYVEAVQALYPQYIEELQGMADGSGLDFEKFMITSMIPEYVFLLTLPEAQQPRGCSTVSYSYDGKVYLSHNEDGAYSLRDLMFIVKGHPTGKPSFIGFCHPGSVMCIGPAMNDAGIFYCGNYVTGTEFQEGGIPSAFIERSLMEAQTLDEAIQKTTISNRAYCYHVNLASRDAAKVVSLEVSPSTYYLYEVDGLFVHTNHFFQPGMETLSVPNGNSESRLEVLSGLTNAYAGRLGDVYGDLLTQFLSSHDQYPDSPCSHGGEDVHISQTLGNTLFDVNNGTWRISYNNPCQRRFQTVGF